MKRLLIVVLLLIGVALRAQEIRRPTADSGSMPNAFDAAGLTTASNLSAVRSYKGITSKTDYIGTWQTPSYPYSSLTLNVNSASNGWQSLSEFGGDGTACINYSKDGGVTWTVIVCDNDGTGWTQQTFSLSIPTSQDFTKLQIQVKVSGIAVDSPGDIGGDNIEIWDIWTSGTGSAPPAGNGSSAGLPHRSAVIVN